MNNDVSNQPAVQFAITWEKGKVSEITTNSRQVNHFLDLMRMSRAYNTWVSYAQDLKVFFKVIMKTPETITRADCLEFMKQQDRAGCSGATINRRLAAISSLFNELCLLEPEHFSRNPVYPRQGYWESKRKGQSLYRKQAQPIPKILSEHELHTFFSALHSWRDRTLVLLMWISCLRISEAVNDRRLDRNLNVIRHPDTANAILDLDRQAEHVQRTDLIDQVGVLADKFESGVLHLLNSNGVDVSIHIQAVFFQLPAQFVEKALRAVPRMCHVCAVTLRLFIILEWAIWFVYSVAVLPFFIGEAFLADDAVRPFLFRIFGCSHLNTSMWNEKSRDEYVSAFYVPICLLFIWNSGISPGGNRSDPHARDIRYDAPVSIAATNSLAPGTSMARACQCRQTDRAESPRSIQRCAPPVCDRSRPNNAGLR